MKYYYEIYETDGACVTTSPEYDTKDDCITNMLSYMQYELTHDDIGDFGSFAYTIFKVESRTIQSGLVYDVVPLIT